METADATSKVRTAWPATAGFLVSIAAIAAAIGAGAGTRLGWWEFSQGFRILNWAAYFGVAGTLLSLAGAILSRPGGRSRGLLPSIAGILLGAIAFGVPASYYYTAMRVPRIHDITTDTANPPKFQFVLDLRKGAPNSPEYGGPEIAAQQREAYPDIRPLEADIPPAKAYEKALDVAVKMGWQIVNGNGREGRIEATDTTRWFGFKDDIVIRITPTSENRSRLDIRSASRVGISDVGANACRIRAFLKRYGRQS